MREITIEWKHYDKEGETCTRCNNTGENIKLALAYIARDFKDLHVEYLETKLKAKDMQESNSVIINGRLLEDILGYKSSSNHCHSCTCLSGADTDCRTIENEDAIYEEIPTELIIAAITKMA